MGVGGPAGGPALRPRSAASGIGASIGSRRLPRLSTHPHPGPPEPCLKMRMEGKAVMKCLRHRSTSAVQSTCRGVWGAGVCFGAREEQAAPASLQGRRTQPRSNTAAPASMSNSLPRLAAAGSCRGRRRLTLARRMRPSLSGYFACTSSVTASQVGPSRWHHGHQGAKKLTTSTS